MKIDTYTSAGLPSTTPAKLAEAATLPEKNLNSNTNSNNAEVQKFPPDHIEKVVKVANNISKMMDARFEYSYNKDINMDIIKVIDKDTNKEVRQYPADEIVNMLTRMYDMLGIIVDQKI